MIKTAVEVAELAPKPAQRAGHAGWQPVSTPVIIAGIVPVYLVAAFSSALTQQPWCDEAWNSSLALSLITRGFMGTPVLETAGTWLTGIDLYTCNGSCRCIRSGRRAGTKSSASECSPCASTPCSGAWWRWAHSS